MNVLFETDKLCIEHEYECAYLIEKSSGKELLFDIFYGDPQCGLISLNNDWAIIAGEHLTIWTPDKWKIINDDELKWIHSLRSKNTETVEILTDPWFEKSAIWEFDVKTFS
jgi:hypothetical protein